MIEFNGYLSGVAEKRFWKKERALARRFILIGLILVLPWLLFYCIKSRNWLLITMCGVGSVVIELLTFIPQSKKEKKKLTPKKITIDEDFYIVCKTDKEVETRSITDVKTVKDCGEYYELIFAMGKVSNRFICQKNLLTKGTLEEFEALFCEKLERINKV